METKDIKCLIMKIKLPPFGEMSFSLNYIPFHDSPQITYESFDVSSTNQYSLVLPQPFLSRPGPCVIAEGENEIINQ